MLSSPFNRLQEQQNKKLINQELVKEINNIKKRNMLIHQSNFIKMQKYKQSLEEKHKNQLLLEEKQKTQLALEEKPKNKKSFCFIDAEKPKQIDLKQQQHPNLEKSKNIKTFTFV